MNNIIREMLKTKDLTVTYVIEKTGISRSYFYDVINGKSVPSLIVARKIAEIIGVRLDELFPNDNSNKEIENE